MIRRKRVVATVGLVAAALALALAGAGASMALGGGGDRAFRVTAGPADLTKIKHAAPLVLSSRPAIDRYLRSIHVNPKTVVFQRGALNYAGPTCPGKQWNCTSAHRVVQIASRLASRSLQPENNFQCSPEGTGTVSPTNCMILQVPAGPGVTNQHADCKIHAKDSAAIACTIIQTNVTGGSNDATVEMKIDDNDGSTQSGTESAMITQSAAGAGNNTANVNMDINLKTNDGTTQIQDGYQSLVLSQTAVNGSNNTKLDQSQDLNAKLKKTAAGEQDQNTNAMPDPCNGAVVDANSCVQYDQSTGSGNNKINVKQHHNLDGWAKNSDEAFQNQGCSSSPGNKVCGIEEVGTQDTASGTDTADVNQEGKYKLDGPSGSSNQIQDPRFGGAFSQQIGSPNDRFTIRQSAELNGGDEQSHDNVVSDSSTGIVDALSKIKTDTQSSTVSCMGPSCDYEQECSSAPEETDRFGFLSYIGTDVGCPSNQTVTSPTTTVFTGPS